MSKPKRIAISVGVGIAAYMVPNQVSYELNFRFPVHGLLLLVLGIVVGTLTYRWITKRAG